MVNVKTVIVNFSFAEYIVLKSYLLVSYMFVFFSSSCYIFLSSICLPVVCYMSSFSLHNLALSCPLVSPATVGKLCHMRSEIQ